MAKNQNKNQQKPAQKEEPKGLIARVGEAIDHVIHPDAQPKSEPDLVESSVEKKRPYNDHQSEWESKKEREQASRALRSRKEVQDLEKHPKFSKFKKGVN